MVKTRHRPLTVADYRAVPEGGSRYQLIDGDLIVAPAPNRFHQKICRNLQFQIMRYLEDHPIGELYGAPFDVELSEVDVFQPDLVYVKREHASILTDQGMSGGPDLVVEVLSPRTALYDLGVKREIYARVGVAELWIIDPAPRRFSRYLLQQDSVHPAQTFEESGAVTTPLFPGLTINLYRAFNAGL